MYTNIESRLETHPLESYRDEVLVIASGNFIRYGWDFR